MTSKAPAINPLVKPLIEGYQERMQKYKTEFETLQRLSKQCGTDYTMLAQKVHENELVLAVSLFFFEFTSIFGRLDGLTV